MNIRDTALVFSGGGARGAFQVGAWEALHETHVVDKVCAVYGTSVGAINGAAFVQGDLQLAREIWEHLNFENIFNELSSAEVSRLSRKHYLSLARKIVTDKGLNVEPLKELLRNNLSEEKIRESPLDFGIVVYNLSKKAPEYLRKDQIPKGQLIEYIIASATFPLFQPHRIANSIFIDGGVTDNRPLDFVDDHEGINSVICIDVTIARYFWKNKKPKRPVKVSYLRPSQLLGSPMAFRNDRIKKNMNLGYNDSLIQIAQSKLI